MKATIRIKEPVMIGGKHYAPKEKVTVGVDDAAIVVGMGRAEYVKAEAKREDNAGEVTKAK